MEKRTVIYDGRTMAIDEVLHYFGTDVVPIPTETVYGLAAPLWREDLLRRVFEVKNRPADNPLIVHVSSTDMLMECIDGPIPEMCKALIEKHWPGPLTLLFRKSSRVPSIATANSELVAVRMPDHRVALEIITKLGTPLVGPSANKSTRPSPTSAQHVYDDLSGEVPIVIDGGPCAHGLESTVVNCLVDPPVLLRLGALTYEELKKTVPALTLLEHSGSSAAQPSCPGLKHKHYSPRAPVAMVRGAASEQAFKLERIIRKSIGAPGHIGVVAPGHIVKQVELIAEKTGLHGSKGAGQGAERMCVYGSGKLATYNLGTDNKEIARRVFEGLRSMDKVSSVIYVTDLEEIEEGRAIMDRLKRASSEFI